MTIRCTPLRTGLSYCRVPNPSFTGSFPCRACERELLWSAKHRPTRDIRPVRWMKVEDLHSQHGVRLSKAVVQR